MLYAKTIFCVTASTRTFLAEFVVAGAMNINAARNLSLAVGPAHWSRSDSGSRSSSTQTANRPRSARHNSDRGNVVVHHADHLITVRAGTPRMGSTAFSPPSMIHRTTATNTSADR
jgi:hypothetical protein